MLYPFELRAHVEPLQYRIGPKISFWLETQQKPRRSFILKCARWHSLGVIDLAEIRLQEGESLENALRRFKRKVQTEDIIKEVKRHSYYLKPGEKKRLKQALARKRARKKIRREPE